MVLLVVLKVVHGKFLKSSGLKSLDSLLLKDFLQ